MIQQISKDAVISQPITVTEGAAGAIDLTGDEVDMQGFEGVIFVFQFGAIVATSVIEIRAQQDIVTGMAGAADLLGTAQAVADDDDNTVFYIDIYKPRERFLRPMVDIATADATVAVTAIKYGAHDLPITEDAEVQGETHISPAEGTA